MSYHLAVLTVMRGESELRLRLSIHIALIPETGKSSKLCGKL